MAKAKFSYQKGIEELQIILEDLESGETGIDQLQAKVQRGKELLEKCQDMLRTTEKEIEKMIE